MQKHVFHPPKIKNSISYCTRTQTHIQYNLFGFHRHIRSRSTIDLSEFFNKLGCIGWSTFSLLISTITAYIIICKAASTDWSLTDCSESVINSYLDLQGCIDWLIPCRFFILITIIDLALSDPLFNAISPVIKLTKISKACLDIFS
jgi:hypothetical protein